MATNVAVFLPSKAVFGETGDREDAIRALLKLINIADAVEFCAFLNVIISGLGSAPDADRQWTALMGIVGHDEEVMSRINQARREIADLDKLTIFFRGQLIELAGYAVRYCTADREIDNLLHPDGGDVYLSNRVNFFKAALIAGEIERSRNVEPIFAEELDSADFKVRIAGKMRRALEGSARMPHLGHLIGRGQALFGEFLPEKHAGFVQEFENMTGVSLDQYFTCLAMLMPALNAERARDWVIPANGIGIDSSQHGMFQRFMSLESKSISELKSAARSSKKFRAEIMKKPIVRTRDNRCVVLDPIFLSEKISIGPLFALVAQKSKEDGDNLLASFGQAFESYSQSIIREGAVHGGWLRHDMNVPFPVPGRQDPYELDAVVFNNLAAATIFEAKAAWIREDCVDDGGPEDFATHVRKKYGASDEAEKGVAQLARNIGHIIRGEMVNPAYWSGILCFFPILLVHDTRLSTVGDLLNDDFKKLLGEVPKGRKVADLILMTVVDIEVIEFTLAEFSLWEILHDYDRVCFDRQDSLAEFLNLHPKYRGRLHQNQRLQTLCNQLFERTKSVLFPKAPDAVVTDTPSIV